MKYALLTFSLLFIACANLSKNSIKEGDFSIKRGVYKNQSWDESLNFDRVSWYHELSLNFDLLITKVDSTSPFLNWLSPSEKALFNECKDHFLALTYHLDSDRISKRMFYSQMNEQGYKDYLIPNFARALKLHPDFEFLSLQLYQVSLLCNKDKAGELEVTFPSFRTVKLSK